MALQVKDLKIGDEVCITWMDHYRWKGERPKSMMLVQSWGEVIEITPDGIALAQNEVQISEDMDIEQIMDGQFCLRQSVVSIEILRRLK